MQSSARSRLRSRVIVGRLDTGRERFRDPPRPKVFEFLETLPESTGEGYIEIEGKEFSHGPCVMTRAVRMGDSRGAPALSRCSVDANRRGGIGCRAIRLICENRMAKSGTLPSITGQTLCLPGWTSIADVCGVASRGLRQ